MEALSGSRRLDVASLVLLLIGLVFGGVLLLACHRPGIQRARHGPIDRRSHDRRDSHHQARGVGPCRHPDRELGEPPRLASQDRVTRVSARYRDMAEFASSD